MTRVNGEGTIFQNKRGYSVGMVRYTDPLTGQRKRHAVYGKDDAEALAKLNAARERLKAGEPARDSRMTVGSWLSEWRGGALAASSRSESTKAGYSRLSANHLDPALGAIPLDRLRPSDVDRLILSLRAKGYGDSLQRQVYITLRLALADAVRDGLIAQNVAAKVKPPRIARKEARFLSASEVARLLDAAKGSRYHPLLSFIARTGVRKSEALNTKWTDVDLDAATYRVPGTKTDSSRRTLALSPALVQLLKQRKKQQAEERLRAGSEWTHSDLVFTTETGTAVSGRNTLRALMSAADKAKLEGVCVHTLRHSAATALLENNVNIKCVSYILGHKNIATTVDLYGHVTDQTVRDAADVLSQAIGV